MNRVHLANVQQYEATKRFINRFEEAVAAAEALVAQQENAIVLKRAEIAGMKSLIEDLKWEAQDWEDKNQ